jgi:hypothetical protein
MELAILTMCRRSMFTSANVLLASVVGREAIANITRRALGHTIRRTFFSCGSCTVLTGARLS